MSEYAVFGGCLRSDELSFPELHPAFGRTPNWSLRIARDASVDEPCEVLGVSPHVGCKIALYRMPNGFRLHHSCSGDFDISTDGSDILWHPCPGAGFETVRNDVLGRVLSVSLHLSGIMPLHGSAVAFEDNAVAFLAPKHHGKSTLVTALTRAGGAPLTDDTVAVDPGPPTFIRPGVYSVRLYRDSACKLFDEEIGQRRALDGKHVVDYAADFSPSADRIPLSAIYLVKPVTPGAVTAPASRSRLSASQAAISILANAKIGMLLGKEQTQRAFECSVILARSVPVYSLEVVRDFERIDEVVELISGWHQLPDAIPA